MLEELDARIAAVLAADGRCSYTDLAERVGLSVSAVHQRVRRLEKRGVIRGYSAQIDCEQIGLPLTAFVSLTPIDPGSAGRLSAAAGRDVGDRGLPFGRRRRVLHRQGAGRLAGRAGGAAGADSRQRRPVDEDHGGAVHAVREPPGHPAVVRRSRRPDAPLGRRGRRLTLPAGDRPAAATGAAIA